MADTPDLPPSLAVTPNIPFSRQTLDQLRAELTYWKKQAEAKTGWGSAFAAALEHIYNILAEINRRQKP